MRNAFWIIVAGLLFLSAPAHAQVDEAQQWWMQGNQLSASGKWEEAVDAYHRAIQINPDATGPFFNLGLAYKALHQYERAAAAFERAQQLEPGNMDVHLRLGNIYNLMEKWDKAIEHLNLVVHRVPDNAEAHGNLGWALLNYSEGPQFKMLVIHNLEKAVLLFEKQDMARAAEATRKTLEEVRKRFGYKRDVY
ncbi:tetratricopeptide repeat protein [Nitrospina watsonii]|uniref:TPR_REGION domain-containing protein n=1 Tax=Nitrospina watsonii TaxID=1323948 RepID=A0ABM9HFE2_9BACT|nr:tetratricopeptide repeat protein [Nitrospina watsonii]CAI2718949.1 TPR_REGION domain-containing protein [Nitrospina watsonii]